MNCNTKLNLSRQQQVWKVFKVFKIQLRWKSSKLNVSIHPSGHSQFTNMWSDLIFYCLLLCRWISWMRKKERQRSSMLRYHHVLMFGCRCWNSAAAFMNALSGEPGFKFAYVQLMTLAVKPSFCESICNLSTRGFIRLKSTVTEKLLMFLRKHQQFNNFTTQPNIEAQDDGG